MPTYQRAGAESAASSHQPARQDQRPSLGNKCFDLGGRGTMGHAATSKRHGVATQMRKCGASLGLSRQAPGCLVAETLAASLNEEKLMRRTVTISISSPRLRAATSPGG